MILDFDENKKAEYEVVWMKKAILLWFGVLLLSGFFVLHSLSFTPLFVTIAIPGFFGALFIGSVIGGYAFFRKNKSLSRTKALKETFRTLF